MFKGRVTYLPDLDALDSPLGSSVPFTAAFSIPGSALAERIFNDPDSWEDTDVEEGDFPEDVMVNDQLAWLTEEIEKFRATSAGLEPSVPFEVTFDKDVVKDKGFFPTDIHVDEAKVDTDGWKGIGKRKTVRPISLAALFDRPNDEFATDIQQQLSKILDSGGIRHQVRPLSSALSPPSSSDTNSTIDTPLHIHSASSIDSSSSGASSPSPINIHSASATLSFLEWYGIYPDTPKMVDTNTRRLTLQRTKSRRMTPALQVPTPRHASRTSPLINTSATSELAQNAPSEQSSSGNPPGLPLPPPPPSAPVAIKVEKHENSKPAPPPGLSRVPTPPTRKRSPVLPQPPVPVVSKPASLPSASESSIPTTSSTRSSSRHALPHPRAAPPAYTRASSPAPSLVRNVASAQGTRSQSTMAPSHSRTLSTDSMSQRRRLPNVPPAELQQELASTNTSTSIIVPGSRSATPVARSKTPPQRAGTPRGPAQRGSPSTTSPQSAAPLNTPMTSLLRSASSARMPLTGPAGPRTRARGGCEITSPSRKMSDDSHHRPAALRL